MQQEQIQTSQPIQTKPIKKKSKLWLWLLIILIIIAAGIGAYFLLKGTGTLGGVPRPPALPD